MIQINPMLQTPCQNKANRAKGDLVLGKMLIPKDIVDLIFDLISPTDVLSTRMVSWSWKEITDQKLLSYWKHLKGKVFLGPVNLSRIEQEASLEQENVQENPRLLFEKLNRKFLALGAS